MEVFTFVLLSLTAYRMQRIITKDEWPPSVRFRVWLYTRYGKDSGWYTLFTCHYCIGTWITLAVFAIAAQYINIPFPALQAIAGAAVVGYLGEKES